MMVINYQNSQIKVLFASHFGEPWGGISIQNELILKSKLPEIINLQTIGTSSGNLGFKDRGKASFVNIKNAVKNIILFVRRFNEFRPDIVDIGTAYGMSFLKHGIMALYAHYRGAKTVITFRCSKEKILDQSIFFDHFADFILKRMTGVIAISKEWLNISNQYPNLKISYIPNAVDTKLFSDNLSKRELNEQSRINILYMGHIQKEKGIYDLIEAVGLLVDYNIDNFSIQLVGGIDETGEEKDILNEISQHGLSELIKIFPPIFGEPKLSFFHEADILVLPSYHEGMPNVILEGMAAGLAIVATNVGGIPDQVLDGKTGILIPPRDALALSQALSRLIQDQTYCYKLGVTGQERVAKYFNIPVKVNKLLAFYQSLFCNE